MLIDFNSSLQETESGICVYGPVGGLFMCFFTNTYGNFSKKIPKKISLQTCILMDGFDSPKPISKVYALKTTCPR